MLIKELVAVLLTYPQDAVVYRYESACSSCDADPDGIGDYADPYPKYHDGIKSIVPYPLDEKSNVVTL